MQMSICILVIAESLGAIENFTNLLASHSSFEHNIFVAANVEQAITLANLAQFDVVITHLPAMEMGAFESIVQLKCALQAKPILVISDAEEHALIAQAIRRLSEGLITRRDLSSELLIQAIQAAIETKSSHQSAQNGEILFNAWFENTNDAVLICGIDYTILSVNQHLAEFLGFSESELKGRNLGELICQCQRDLLKSDALALLTDLPLPTFERNFIRKNGREIRAEVKASIITEAFGTPLYYLLILRESRVSIEADHLRNGEHGLSSSYLLRERSTELQAINQELSRSLRAKDQFLATVSHELRTPLASLLNLAESIQEGIYGPLNERQDEMLSKVRQSGNHLLLLLNDILEISRIETRGLALDLEVVAIEEVCRNSFFLVQETARSREIQVHLSNRSNGSILIADERRLTQVIVNLLGNAIKYTPKGGDVGLEVYEGLHSPVAEPNISEPNIAESNGEFISQRTIQFTVWDTGIGIAEEDIPRLFQPFVQLQNHWHDPNGGSGLGLTLVDRLVKLHGGSVTVKSKIGEGSRFTVTLPWRTLLDSSYPLPVIESSADAWTVI